MKKLLLPAGLAAAAVLFSACGDSSTATTSSVLNMSSSNYATLPTTPSTLPPSSTAVGETIAPGTQTTEITEYTIKDGDVPFTVANKFGITLDALNLANADTSGYSAFYVGLKIKIPVGATIPSASTDTTTTAAGATPSETPPRSPVAARTAPRAATPSSRAICRARWPRSSTSRWRSSTRPTSTPRATRTSSWV